MSNKPSLAQLRERFKQQKTSKESKNFTSNDVYPFWQMSVDNQAVVRILPDANSDNPNVFFVDKMEHTLSINGKDRKIPCLQMYGQKCPICEISRDFYKQKDEVQGKYYYRKKTSLARVLVMDDPLPPNEQGEKFTNKVCNTQFSYQIMEKIVEQISDDSENGLECEPWNMDMGYDFIIKKTPQGDYGTYAIGSTFKRKPSAIPDNLREGIELVDLTTLLPKNPGEEKIQALLSAHLTGEELNEEEAGVTRGPTPAKPAAPSKPAVAAPVSRVVAEQEEEEEEEAEVISALTSTDEDEDDDNELLRRIKGRISGNK